MNILKRIIFCLCLLATVNVWAVTKVAKASGNWNVAATWTGGVPAAGDDIQIPATFTVTVTAATTCNSLTIFAGPPSAGQVSINAQTLTVTTFVTNNGTILLTTGTLKIGADFSTPGTLTVGTGTINFDGTVNQNLSCTTAFYNLTIANTGGATNTVTLANPITVANTLTLTSGVLDVSASNYEITCQGTFTNNDATVGAFNGEAGIVDFTGAASVINGTKVTTFFNLNCDVTGVGTLTSTTDAETVLGALNVNTGTLALLTRVITTTGNATIASGTTVTFTTGGLTVGANLICNGTLGTAAATTGNVNVTTGTTTIGNTGTIELGTGTLTSAGDLTCNSGQIIFTGGGNMKLAGNYTQNGTFTSGTSIVTFNGSGSQTIGGTSAIMFNKLTINGTGTVTLADSITVGSILTLTTGILDVSANDYGITCEGNFTNNDATVGAFVPRSGRVWFVGSQTMPGTKATTFNDVEIKSGTITLNLAITVSDTLNLLGGTLTTGALAVNIGSTLLNNSGATFTAGAGIVTFTGNTVQHCFIGGGNAITIPNLTTNLAHQTDTLYLNNSALTVSTAFKISQGVFHCQTNSVIGSLAALTTTISAGTTFILGLPTVATAVSFPATKTFAIAATSTVIYQANTSQVVTTTTYGNLDIYTGIGTVDTASLSSAAALNVANNLIIGNNASSGVVLTATTNVITLNGASPYGNCTINTDGAIYFSGAGSLKLTGNFTNNSTLTMSAGITGLRASASTVTFNGAVNQTLGGTKPTTFNNLTVSMVAVGNTVTLGDSTTVLGTFDITKGIFDVSLSNYSLLVEGAFTNAASATAIAPENGTVYFGVGTGNVTLAASTQTNLFYNVICNPGSGNSVLATGSNTTINNNLTVKNGTLSGTTKTITVTDSVAIMGSSTVISYTNGKLLVTGDIYNTGTITFSIGGTVTAGGNFYNNSSAASPTLNAVSSTVTITGNLYNISGGITFTTGTLNQSTITDSITNYNGQTITMGTGKLLAIGDIYNTGTITFTGVGGFTGANLFINGPAGFITGGTVVATMSANTTIASGGTMTLSTGTLSTAGNLLLNGTLTYTGAGNLKVGGNYTDNGTYTYFTNTTTFTGGAGGIQLIGGTGGPGLNPLPLQFYNLTVNGNATDVVTLADSIQVNNLFLLTAGTFDQSTSNYSLTCLKGFTNNDATSAFVGRNGWVYFVGAQTLTGTQTTNFSDVRITNGSLTVSKSTVVQDTLELITVTTAGTFGNASPQVVTIGCAFLNNSGTAFTSSTGNILFTGNTTAKNYIGGTQAITVKNMTVNLAHASDTLFLYKEGITVNTTGLTLTQGVLHCQTFTLVGAAVGALFSVQDNATLILGVKTDPTVVPFPTLFTGPHITLTNASTVIYQANAAQVISLTPTNYGNLDLYSGGSSVSKTIAGNLTVNGNLIVGNAIGTGIVTLPATAHTVAVLGNVSIHSDAIMSFTTGPLNIGGNLSNFHTGTGLTAGTNTTTFNGAVSNQKIKGTVTTNFNNVIINNTASAPNDTIELLDSTYVGGTFVITSGVVSQSPSGHSLVVNNNFSNNSGIAAFAGGNGITYFDAALTVGGTSATKFGSVTCNPGVGNTVTISAGLNDEVNGNLLARTGTLAAGATTLTVDTNVTFSGGAMTISGTLNVGGNFTNNNAVGSYSAAGSTTNFTGTTTTQSIGGTASSTFNNVGISSYNAIITANENATGAFVINSGGTFDCSSSRKIMAVTGAFTNGGTFLGDNGILTLGSDLTNNSTFTAGTGMVTFNGAAANHNLGGTTSIQLYDLTVNCSALANTVTLTANESFNDSISMQKGTLQAATGKIMTLISNAVNTGRIGTIASTANATIIDSFLVQRYESVRGTAAADITLSAPVATTVGDWNISNQTAPNIMYMSGVGGPNGTSGSGSGFISVYKVDETKSATGSACYVHITNYASPGINYVIQPGDGIFMFLATSINTMSDPFTYVQHGVPTVGAPAHVTPITVTPAGLDGFNVIGNPYASAISWTKFKQQNPGLGLQASYYLMEASGSWVATATDAIPMCQGFGVAATSPGTAVFVETEKLYGSGSAPLDVAFGPGTVNDPGVTFELSNDANTFSCPTTIKFGSGFSKTYSLSNDARFMFSNTIGVPILYTTSADNMIMQVKSLPDSEVVQEIPLTAIGQVIAKHTITMEGSVNEYQCINLIDKATGKLLNNFSSNPSYTYNVTSPQQETDFILQFTKLSPGEVCRTPESVTNINVLPSNVNVVSNTNGALVQFNLVKPSDVVVSVYDIVGKKVIEDIRTNAYNNSLQLNLAPGEIYIVKIQTNDGLIIKKLYH